MEHKCGDGVLDREGEEGVEVRCNGYVGGDGVGEL